LSFLLVILKIILKNYIILIFFLIKKITATSKQALRWFGSVMTQQVIKGDYQA
jgi:hypothetical protein